MVQWEVTPVCNHNCIHCYNYWRSVQPTSPFVENYEILYSHIVSELVNNKVFGVVITGGEPLVVIEKIQTYIKSLVEGGIRVTLNSNLSVLNKNKAEILKACGVKSILVSLPSADPQVCDQITGVDGSLPRIIKGIKLAKSFGFPLYVNMVVSKINFNQIIETAELVSSLGLTNFAVTRASDPSSNKGFADQVLDLNDFRKMQRSLELAGRKFSLKMNSLEANPICAYGDIKPVQGYKFCTAGKTTCTIGFDGNVRPCNRISESYGNISLGLHTVWQAMSIWRTEELLPEVCQDCAVKTRCLGGCKADAITLYNSKKEVDPLCDMKYMPQLDELRKPEIPPTSDNIFRVNPKLHTREELFGGILFVTPSSWVPVDHRLYKLFSPKRDVIALHEIQKVLNVGMEKTIPVASYLKHKQIFL